MQLLIADTFTSSLARLTGDEQKAAKTTAFDLQLDPANPGMQFHRIDKSKDKNFWSIRVNRDVRIVVHRTAASFLLCYVDHHERAYQWAERRKIETHPKTGAAQIVEVRESVREIEVPRFVDKPVEAPPKPALFAARSDEQLLAYGVPSGWLEEVKAATEDTLLELAGHLPAEAGEALLELATGGTVEPVAAETPADPFEHPDAKRRFRVMHNIEELEQALEYPWERWSVFLHPAQQDLVERDYSGPARVSGSAGTGKTVVGLHRAAHLARAHPAARVLLATFSETLANLLRARLRILIHHEPRLGERIEVHSMDAVGKRLRELNAGPIQLATTAQINDALRRAGAAFPDLGFSRSFLRSEWSAVVDDWQLQTWEEYRDVARLGRKTRLPQARRLALWQVFERVNAELAAEGLATSASMFTALAGKLRETKSKPFEFAVIDEAQDLSVAQLRFLAALGGDRQNSLFFAGDLGQRIFQQPFSWLALGVDIRGRSRVLRINYRTSHQIRTQADRLLGPEIADVDGNVEERKGTVSVFNGPAPEIHVATSEDDEAAYVAAWLQARRDEGIHPDEMAVFVRSELQLDRARTAVDAAGLLHSVLDEHPTPRAGHVSVSTMHMAKGLEFRSVVVMACDDEVLPLQQRIETVADESELEDVYNTERHLLYVACTRARDHLLVTSGGEPSEFLDDMRTAAAAR
jgi:superfamily I DNA/RNA helicase